MEKWQFISVWNSVGRRSVDGKVDPSEVARELGGHVSAGMCYSEYLRLRRKYKLHRAHSPKRGTGTTTKRTQISDLIRMVQKTMIELENG